FCTAVPPSAADPYSVFAEPGIVEASDDGINFRMFPYDAAALSQVVSICTDKSLLQRLIGLAGVTPSFTGNYLVPDDPLVFDTAATPSTWPRSGWRARDSCGSPIRICRSASPARPTGSIWMRSWRSTRAR